MHQHFERLFKIVKKTGNNLVIFDQESKDPYILMNLEEYEELLESYADPVPQKTKEDLTPSSETPTEREEVLLRPRAEKTEKIPLKQVNEAEAIPGIDTEVVNLGEVEGQNEEEQTEKYYFEEVQGGEKEVESDKNQKGDN